MNISKMDINKLSWLQSALLKAKFLLQMIKNSTLNHSFYNPQAKWKSKEIYIQIKNYTSNYKYEEKFKLHIGKINNLNFRSRINHYLQYLSSLKPIINIQ